MPAVPLRGDLLAAFELKQVRLAQLVKKEFENRPGVMGLEARLKD